MATQEMTARTGNSGFLDSYFSITQRGSTVRQELLAGLTTFLAMVYSIIVVPNMLGAAGFEQGPVFVATCLIAAFAIRVNAPVLHVDGDFAALARHTPLVTHADSAE